MDYCIKNGTLVDPAAGHVGRFDLLIREGKVVEVAPELVAPDDVTVIDAADYIFSGFGGHACPLP